MRVGSICPLDQPARITSLIERGFGFIELTETRSLATLPPISVPVIWQCPPDLPADHPDEQIRAAVLNLWRSHLDAAQKNRAALMVLQFKRPEILPEKSVFIENYAALLTPISAEGRDAGIQVVLRNSADNRDQLQLLREIVRRVPHLGIALDIAYAHHRVIRNLTPEYLWDSDLGGRLAHIYASDTNGQDASLRLPPGCLGKIDWARLVSELRQRYNASVTIDAGDASLDYLELARANWLAWWQS